MEQQPLFTIITPTFNSAFFVDRLIDSVQSQDFTDFEHLILDGQSTDDTINILKNYASKCSNVTLSIAKDKGIYDAMNKGLKIAKGKWIFFIGSDDYFYAQDVLGKIAAVIHQNEDTDLVYGDVWFEKYQRVYDGYFSINKLLSQNVCHQSMFFKKKLFDQLGEFDLQYKNCADYQFNLLCWLNPEVKKRYTPVVVSFFSEGGVSTTNTDAIFIQTFPYTIVEQSLNSNFHYLRKCLILSDCFRKILLRYGFSTIRNILKKNVNKIYITLPSLLLMSILILYYMFKNILKRII